GRPAAVIADVPALAAHGLASSTFASRLAQSLPHVRVYVRLPSRAGITRGERAWAARAGIASLLPGSTTAAWRQLFAPVIQRVVAGLDVEVLDEEALADAVTRLVASGAEPRAGALKDIWMLAKRLEQERVDNAKVFQALRDESHLVSDRRYRGKIYPECFVA